MAAVDNTLTHGYVVQGNASGVPAEWHASGRGSSGGGVAKGGACVGDLAKHKGGRMDEARK